jgi:hypothetical protein
MFVVLVMGDERIFDFVMLEQFPGCPCILSQDEIGIFQDLYSPVGNILEVSDRGGYYT